MNDPWAEIKALRMQAPPEQTVEPIKPNRMGMNLAALLRKGKEWGNAPGKLPESVPLIGGMGVGDLIMGETPEMTEDWAHGFPPWKGQGMGAQVKPEAIDYVGVPMAGAAGALGHRVATNTLRRGAGQSIEGATDASRRKFLGQMGAAGAVMAMPDLLRRYTDDVVVDAATKVAPKAFSSAEVAGKIISEKVAKMFDPRDFNPAALKEATDLASNSLRKTIDGILELVPVEKRTPGWEDRLTKAMEGYDEITTESYSHQLSELFGGDKDRISKVKQAMFNNDLYSDVYEPEEIAEFIVNDVKPKGMSDDLALFLKETPNGRAELASSMEYHAGGAPMDQTIYELLYDNPDLF